MLKSRYTCYVYRFSTFDNDLNYLSSSILDDITIIYIIALKTLCNDITFYFLRGFKPNHCKVMNVRSTFLWTTNYRNAACN